MGARAADVTEVGLSRPRLSARRRTLVARIATIAALAGSVLLGLLLYLASVHTFGGNSDGATVVLEGQAISAGHLTLGGWSLTLESFWSVDALVYAAVIRVVGMHANLIHVVPALIALGVVVVGIVLGRRGYRGAGAVVAALLVLALLGFPNPNLAFFFLQGPWHICTALWCLIAFAAMSGSRPRRGLLPAAVLLAAGLLGDFMTIAIGLAPFFLTGLTTMRRARRLRAGTSLLLVVPLAVLLAFGIRAVARAVGTFSIVNRNVVITRAQIDWNLSHLVANFLAILGVGKLAIGVPAESLTIEALHVLGALVVAGGLCWAAVDLLLGIVVPRRSVPSPRASARVDDLLFFAFAGSVATYVVTAPTSNPDYLRYLSPAVIFAALLGARFGARLVGLLGERAVRRVSLPFVGALTAATGVAAVSYLRPPVAPSPAQRLTTFLTAHDLVQGIGDYWSASYVTVKSNGAVAVRPVTNDTAGVLLRFDRQSTSAWYAGTDFQFFVYDTARPWRMVNATSAIATFGNPVHTYAVGSYRVLIWSHPLTLSALLPPQPDPLKLFLHL